MSFGLWSLLPPISVRTTLTCLAWYSVSSITSQLTKLILMKLSYPLFLSQFQFLIGAILALLMITIVKSFPKAVQYLPPGSVPIDPSSSTFKKAILFKILPLGLFQFAGKFFSLSATSLIPLATVSSIKALSPLLIVLGYRLVYKVRFPPVTYLSLTPLVGGVILIIISDSFHAKTKATTANLLTNEENVFDYTQLKGLIFCVSSTLIFAAQNIYGKHLITWESNNANPASMVLNTEISRPGTPGLNNPLEKSHDLTHTHPSKHAPKHYIRQRTNSIKLPFSTHDLKYDDPSLSNNNSSDRLTYDQSVEQANQSVNNPFANIIDLEPVAKPDKMTIIFYCSMIGFTFSFSGFLLKELPGLLRGIAGTESIRGSVESFSDIILVMTLIILDSLSHFLQTLLAFLLLGSIPTLSYSIASMMKRIVLIAVSIIVVLDPNTVPDPESKWFGRITSEQFYGLLLIAIGLYSYDRWGSRSLKGHM